MNSILLAIAILLLGLAGNYSNRAETALAFCKTNKLNTEFCIMVDMSVHSGKNRLFVWDFKKEQVVLTGLCSHGCCDNEWGNDNTKDSPAFSNRSNSHCASLGKFKIGKRGYSNWGINVNYKMHGLEASNSKAYDRIIVLHSWDLVPEQECYPNGTPEGWGCPAISNVLMKKLDKLLLDSESGVLFWIYK